jgi:peroxiredoxin
MTLLDEPAPDFTLESTAGGTVTLSETLADGPSVVVTFRGVWCSYCAEQLGTFSDLAYDLWRHLDVDVLPVAAEPVPELREMRDRFDLSVQLLSDPDLTLSTYCGVQDHDAHGEILKPGTFVVDEAGVVRYEHVGVNAADRTYANYVRAAVRDHDCRDPYGDDWEQY